MIVTSRKIVVRIPRGEVQFGRISKRLTVWFRGRCLFSARLRGDVE